MTICHDGDEPMAQAGVPVTMRKGTLHHCSLILVLLPSAEWVECVYRMKSKRVGFGSLLPAPPQVFRGWPYKKVTLHVIARPSIPFSPVERVR